MADEKTRPDDTTNSPDSEDIESLRKQRDESMAAYKALQRQLDKQKKQNKASLDTQLEARFNELKTGMNGILSMLGSSDLLDDAGKQSVASLKESMRSQAAETVGATRAQQRIISLLQRVDLEWEDERLVRAREAWESGNTEDAIHYTEDVVSEMRVEAAVAEQAAKVARITPDMGSSTVGGGVAGMSSAELGKRLQEARLRGDKAFFHNNKDEIMRQYGRR